jgi:hypothetical protein
MALLLMAALAAPASAEQSRVSRPAPPQQLDLYGVSSVAANDVWAVGGYAQGSHPPVTEHWNGSSWAKVPAPQPDGAINSTLTSVAGTSETQTWASGNYYTGGRPHSLLEHWDGGAWTLLDDAVPSDALASALFTVAASDAANVWAGGVVNMPDGSGGGFIEHWNGKTWRALRYFSKVGEFTSIDFDSPSDGWAVGSGGRGTAAYHWDGDSWTHEPTPSPGGADDEGLTSVTALSPKDAWAVGYDDGDRDDAPYAEHWDGTSWTVMPTPVLESDREQLEALSPTDLWAVWSYSTATKDVSLIEHWDGSQWSVATSPHPSKLLDLAGISALSATDIWAVGANESRIGPHPFTEHWNGHAWSLG